MRKRLKYILEMGQHLRTTLMELLEFWPLYPLFFIGFFTLVVALGLGWPQTNRTTVTTWLPIYHGPADVALYGVSFVLLSLYGLTYAVPQLISRIMRQVTAIGTAMSFTELLLILPLSFAGLCSDLFLQFGGFTALSDADWVKFAYSWLLDSLTFNASQVYGWVPTSIQTTAWWSGALIVGFSVVADVILFAGVVTLVRAIIAALRRAKLVTP